MKKQTVYYAIRHKPTGRLMPETTGGYSLWDPSYLNTAYPPRLFITQRAAKNSLTCWLQGRWSIVTDIESEGWEYPSYTVVIGVQPTRVPGRHRDDVEVIPVHLTIA
jgi:hypothetical protein